MSLTPIKLLNSVWLLCDSSIWESVQNFKSQGMGMRERPEVKSREVKDKVRNKTQRARLNQIINAQFERLCIAPNMLLYGLRGCVWSQAGWCGEWDWCMSSPALLLGPLPRSSSFPISWEIDLTLGLSGRTAKPPLSQYSQCHICLKEVKERCV